MNATDAIDEEQSLDDRGILFPFITNGVLLCLVGLLGLLGNVLSMVILSRPQMRSSLNYILIGLARFDCLLIITSILMFGLPSLYSYTELFYGYYWHIFPKIAPFLYPIALIAQTGSLYLTLTVTLERYIAVCHPLKARSICTYGRARLYVLGIVIFSVLYNLPRFWEVITVKGYDHRSNTTVYEAKPSALRSNPIYIQVYINWSYLIVMYFIPFSCLAIFNGAIYSQVRKANNERQRLSRLQKKEIGLAMMLLCVVVVFFLCNILALVANVLESFSGLTIDELVQTSNLLVTINSSVNFVIYCIFGEKFKRLFLKLFCTNFGFPGRESPDGTHDDSVVSNGDGRAYSLRAPYRTTMRSCNGGGMRLGLTKARSITLTTRMATPSPCVYYPARESIKSIEPEITCIPTSVSPPTIVVNCK